MFKQSDKEYRNESIDKDEVLKMARQSNLLGIYADEAIDSVTRFAKLVAAKERDRYMQLFLDPENQPTQFGTATQEYREQEVKEVQSLLTELAHIVRTRHLYGPEVKMLLEKEAAIRARAQADKGEA